MHSNVLILLIFGLDFALAMKSKKVPLHLEPEHASYLAFVTDQEPTDGLLPINTFAAHDQCNLTDIAFKGCHAVLIQPDVALTNRQCLGRQQIRLNNLWVFEF